MPIDNPIGVCLDRNPFDTVDELVARTAAVGFDCAEWFEASEGGPWTLPHTAAHIRFLMRRHELTAQYHAPYEGTYDMGSRGGALRKPEDIARLLSRVLDKTERLGARLVTMHLGTCPRHLDRAEALCNIAEGLRLAEPDLARRHVRLALENHTSAVIARPLGDRPEEFDWLMENVRSEWIGRTLDLGHAHIHGHIADYLARPFDRIFNCHLHDNHGVEDEHLPLGSGSARWDDVLGAIAKKCYRGPMTLEFFGSGADYRKAISLIRRSN